MKKKFSGKAFMVGIGLTLAALIISYLAYDWYLDYNVIRIMPILLAVATFIGAGAAFLYSLQAPANKATITFMPLALKAQLKNAVKTGSENAFQELLQGQRIEASSPESVALVWVEFNETPKRFAVQYIQKNNNVPAGVSTDVESTEFIPASESLIPVIEKLKQRFDTYPYHAPL